jgi:hypothetical protein
MVNCPKGFSQWSKNGRDRPGGKRLPKTADLKDLRAKWWKWWDDANPASRSRLEGRVLPSACDSWDELHLPGKDGFFLFLLALRWWYDRAKGVDKGWLWEEALKSVYSTMCMLLDDLRYNFFFLFLLFSLSHYC